MDHGNGVVSYGQRRGQRSLAEEFRLLRPMKGGDGVSKGFVNDAAVVGVCDHQSPSSRRKLQRRLSTAVVDMHRVDLSYAKILKKILVDSLMILTMLPEASTKIDSNAYGAGKNGSATKAWIRVGGGHEASNIAGRGGAGRFSSISFEHPEHHRRDMHVLLPLVCGMRAPLYGKLSPKQYT